MIDSLDIFNKMEDLLRPLIKNEPHGPSQKIVYYYSLTEEESTSNFQIVLGSNIDYNSELCFSAKIRLLFFNKLFNEIEISELESFLNFHFDKFQFDKKEFLRTFESDIIFVFHQLKKGIKIMRENPTVLVIEVIPFFKNYTEDEFVTYEYYFKECKDWIKSKKYEISKYENNILPDENKNVQNPGVQGKIHLLRIPTKATPEQIIKFWLKLQGDNEKGEPYWKSEQEIKHFLNQNFEDFPGVDELKEFITNMNKSELNHVTWTFFNTYGKSKTKKQYEKLLLHNFTKFKGAKNVYSNIKDQNNEHLKGLLK